MKTIGNRILALCLCLTLTLGCAAAVWADRGSRTAEEPAAAEAEEDVLTNAVSDREAVYVLTDAAGAVEKVIVSDRVTDADGTRTARQEQVRKDLPVDVRFTYRLDGREIAPEELAGKSGSVEIRIDYVNHKYETREISGKQEKIWAPFLLVSALLLDNEHFSNVSVENGRLLNDGSRTVVVGCALPGMAESLALPAYLDLQIPDHVLITADAVDFTLGSVYTVALNDLFRDFDGKDPDALNRLMDSMNDLTDAMDQLLAGAQELEDGLDAMLAGTDALTDGVDTLCGGADRVAAGSGTLADGARDLASGARNVKDGAEQAAAGAGSLLTGADSLAGGAQELSAGLDQISANSAALDSGAQAVFTSLLSSAETQLRANGLTVASLTISNYGEELNRVIASLDPDAVYEQALARVTEAVEAKRPEIEALVTAAVREQVEAAVTASVRVVVSEEVRDAAEARIRAKVEENRGQIEAQVTAAVEAEVRAGVTEAVAAQVRAQVIEAALGMSVEAYEAAVAAGSVDEAVQAAVEAQIAAQLSSDEVLAMIDAQTRTKMASDEIRSLIASTTDQKVEETVLAQMASSEVQAQIAAAVEAQMASDEVLALIAQNVDAKMADPEIQKTIADSTEAQVRKAVADTMAGAEVQGRLAAAAEGAKSVIALKTSLDQYNAFYLGVLSYTAAVDAAAKGAHDLSVGADRLKAGAASLADGSAKLSAGTAALSDGADSLSAGAQALSAGTAQLADGAHTLRSSLPALTEGVRRLRDGSAALRDGLNRFDEEGVEKLSELVSVDAGGLAERLQAIASLGRDCSAEFTGLSGDAESEVRFIYRSAAIGE